MSKRRCFHVLAAALLVLTVFTLPGTQVVTIAQTSSDSWSSWGHDLSSSRFNPAPGAIAAQNVAGLELKWAFVFPGTLSASSQPAIIDDTLYVGSWNAKFYALDARTGHVRWTYDTASFTGPYPSGLGLLTNAIRTAPLWPMERCTSVIFWDTSMPWMPPQAHSCGPRSSIRIRGRV